MAQPVGTPRVNQELMGKFVGQTVRITGRVTGLGAGTFQIQAVDGGNVIVRMSNNQSQVDVGSAVEVIGKVADYQTLDEYNNTVLSEEHAPIDFPVANSALLLSHQWPSLFGWQNQ